MKNFIISLFVSVLMVYTAQASANQGSIRWLTNYDEAVNQSKNTSKPILILFTGSDWCSWCTKLENEALGTPDFAQAAGDSFVFLKLDFPLYTAQDPQLTAKNKQLQKKFEVRSFPTVVLFDGQNNQQIGTTGYRPGGGKQYASQLMKMVSDYSQYKQKMSALDSTSGEELKMLYEKANELGLKEDANAIVKAGMTSDHSLYFLTECYRSLASEGHIQDSEAVAIKQQLLAADPQNEHQIPYQIAVIEFETLCENSSPELAVAPLVNYIEQFGKYDKKNLWQLQMIVSQVYLDKNQLPNALKYAQASHESAPSSVQSDISRAIENIKSQLYSTTTAAVH